MGPPEGALRAAVVDFVGARYPGADEALNRERGKLLAALAAPGIVPAMLSHLAFLDGRSDMLLLSEEVAERSEDYNQAATGMRQNMPSFQEIDIGMTLRHVESGWTLKDRRQYSRWFYDAMQRSGGMSYVGFLENMRADALEHFSLYDREALGALADPYSVKASDFAELPEPEGPGRDWKELGELLRDELAMARDLDRGRRMYKAALCEACHRLYGAGGQIGPDLSTVGTRFSRNDILSAIYLPSKTISDQWAAELVRLTDGRIVVGRVSGKDDDAIRLNQNPYDPEQETELADVAERQVPSVSTMPARLLNRLNGEEVADLMAFLVSGGDAEHDCHTAEKGCEGDE